MAESGVRTRAETARTTVRERDGSEEGSPLRMEGMSVSRDSPGEREARSNLEGDEPRVQRVESDAENGRGLKGDVESGEESAGGRAKRSEAHILGCRSTVGRGNGGMSHGPVASRD